MQNRVGAWMSVLLVGFVCGSAFGKIEAVPGKAYRLTRSHGPWMIMVTSLAGTERQEDARDAAEQLVLALRRKGLPAYTYEQEARIEKFTSSDPLGNPHRRVFAAQRPMVAVVAGNYNTEDDKLAQQTLKWVKSFSPTIRYKSPTTGEMKTYRMSLEKAFLTSNPLQGVQPKKLDPVVEYLNSTTAEHSLLTSKGKYTLVIASFYGSTALKPATFAAFDMQVRSHRTLDAAGQNAWELCKMLKDHDRIRDLKLDVYCYHERYRSIVTVGSFQSQDDPRIDQIRSVFEAKYRRNSQTGEDVLVAESLHLPNTKQGEAPLKTWVLDPAPSLMEVPRSPRS